MKTIVKKLFLASLCLFTCQIAANQHSAKDHEKTDNHSKPQSINFGPGPH